jgi:amino acid transporter
VVSVLLTYLLVAIATQMYAGVGEEGLGLGDPEIEENVFGALAEPVLGSPLNLFLFLAVLASSTASLITTFLPSSRTMLAMGTYRAFPQRFATVHPRFLTPSFATLAAGIGAAAFYKLLFPPLGGLSLALVFFITLRDSAAPDYGSGASIFGVGLVLVLGLGLIALGLIFMFVQRSRDPAFFRGVTLVKDTPALVVEE